MSNPLGVSPLGLDIDWCITLLRSPILRFSTNLLTVLNIKLCKIGMDNGKFVFRNLLAKRNVKNIVYLQFN